MKNTFVYQCYGKGEIYDQVFFSILSLLSKYKNFREAFSVVVVTDQPERVHRFFGNEVETQKLSTEELRQFAGPLNFVHRVKLEVLIKVGKLRSGSLIYMDGDTYFQEPALPFWSDISDTVSLMHVAEGVVSEGRDPLSKKICKFLSKTKLESQIPTSTVMWNAGVIGLSEKNKILLEKALTVTDELYGQYQKHVMEQLAVSFVLQSFTEVRATNAQIVHYWDSKPEYLAAIQRFLQASQGLPGALVTFSQFVHPQKTHPKKTWFSWLGG